MLRAAPTRQSEAVQRPWVLQSREFKAPTKRAQRQMAPPAPCYPGLREKPKGGRTILTSQIREVITLIFGLTIKKKSKINRNTS